ncbi:MAG TPA: hypothetical protein PK867_21605, partial [Pirellulales bacterium]|nr:hypothetical protein [Pirellulales bacterium]
LMVYFCGDTYRDHTCPSEEAEWLPVIQQLNQRLGLTGQSALEGRVHNIFVPVNPAAIGGE